MHKEYLNLIKSSKLAVLLISLSVCNTIACYYPDEIAAAKNTVDQDQKSLDQAKKFLDNFPVNKNNIASAFGYLAAQARVTAAQAKLTTDQATYNTKKADPCMCQTSGFYT